jgi:hypothetical protein
MLDIILKAPVFGRLEKASRVPGAHYNPLLDEIIDRLEDPSDPDNSLVQIARDMGFYSSEAHAVHLKEHWLNDPPGNGFWQGNDTEPIIRKGLAQACRLFRDHGRVMEFFWVMSGSQNASEWQMSVSLCHRTTLVIFHTPRVPCDLQPVDSDTMWVSLEENGAVVLRPVHIPEDGLVQPVSAKKGKKKHHKKGPKPGPKKGKKGGRKKAARRR